MRSLIIVAIAVASAYSMSSTAYAAVATEKDQIVREILIFLPLKQARNVTEF